MRDYMQQEVRYKGREAESRETAAERISQEDRGGCTASMQPDPDSPQSDPDEENADREKFLGSFIETGRSFDPERRAGFPAVPAIFLLKLYKRFLSPLIPPCCRFHPSCSVYGMTAFRVHGLFKGGMLTVWRVFRCSPLFRGGYDPVPPKGSWRPVNQHKE